MKFYKTKNSIHGTIIPNTHSGSAINLSDLKPISILEKYVTLPAGKYFVNAFISMYVDNDGNLAYLSACLMNNKKKILGNEVLYNTISNEEIITTFNISQTINLRKKTHINLGIICGFVETYGEGSITNENDVICLIDPVQFQGSYDPDESPPEQDPNPNRYKYSKTKTNIYIKRIDA